MILKFPTAEVRRLFDHAASSSDHRTEFGSEEKVAGLFLVGDQGVYLASSGLPQLLVDPSAPVGRQSSVVVYAQGASPLDLGWRDLKECSYGGDDGADLIPLTDLGQALAEWEVSSEPGFLKLEVRPNRGDTPGTVAVLGPVDSMLPKVKHWPKCFPAVCRAVPGLTDCAGWCVRCGEETCGRQRFMSYAGQGPMPVCTPKGHRKRKSAAKAKRVPTCGACKAPSLVAGMPARRKRCWCGSMVGPCCALKYGPGQKPIECRACKKGAVVR